MNRTRYCKNSGFSVAICALSEKPIDTYLISGLPSSKAFKLIWYALSPYPVSNAILSLLNKNCPNGFLCAGQRNVDVQELLSHFITFMVIFPVYAKLVDILNFIEFVAAMLPMAGSENGEFVDVHRKGQVEHGVPSTNVWEPKML